MTLANHPVSKYSRHRPIHSWIGISVTQCSNQKECVTNRQKQTWVLLHATKQLVSIAVSTGITTKHGAVSRQQLAMIRAQRQRDWQAYNAHTRTCGRSYRTHGHNVRGGLFALEHTRQHANVKTQRNPWKPNKISRYCTSKTVLPSSSFYERKVTKNIITKTISCHEICANFNYSKRQSNY